MQIQTIEGGKASEPEKLYTLGEVSELTGKKGSDIRALYKKAGISTYDIGNAVCICESDFQKLFGAPKEEKAEIDTAEDEPKKAKRDFKREAKAKVHRKFKIGDLISLKIKSKCGSKEIIRGYRVVKFIYTINDTETNILILKQVSGPKGSIHTLNQHDCKKLHIRYEPELQVFSMFLNWGTFKQREHKQKLKEKCTEEQNSFVSTRQRQTPLLSSR